MKTSEIIWRQYQLRLRTFIRSRVADPAATDDILHNVFLKMHDGLAALQKRDKLQSWLYQITRNAIIDHFRSQKPSISIPEWLALPEIDPGEQVVQELAECLQPMIKRLPDTYREAIYLSEIKGLKQKEVATIQGISLAGAKSRVQRGRKLLGDMLVECCRLEFDHLGRLSGYERKKDGAEKS